MSTETILIVDDNREIVDSLGKLLALEGYDIITAYDGMEALEQLEKNKIDLILLDVMMPRLNGLSALMKIRESYKIPAMLIPLMLTAIIAVVLGFLPDAGPHLYDMAQMAAESITGEGGAYLAG